MEMEVAGYAFAGWEQGYVGLHLAPQLETLRKASLPEALGPLAVRPQSVA